MEVKMSAIPTFEFKNFDINPNNYCFENTSGDELFLQPRLMKLLLVLTAKSNRVVHKDELISQVWDDVIVGDESLSKAVFDLRKFLNENFKEPPMITTIRKVGYRLEFRTEVPIKSRRKKVLSILKTTGYVIAAITLLILILRGLSY